MSDESVEGDGFRVLRFVVSDSSAVAPSGTASPRGPDPPLQFANRRKGDPSGPRFWVYLAIIVVIVAGLAGSVYVATNGFHRNSGSTGPTVIIVNQTSWAIPITQCNAVVFIAPSNSTVNGTLYENGGLDIYTMTPAQYAHYLRYSTIQGYEWTSGVIANNSVYHLDVPVLAGQWDLVFSDPYSNVTYANTLVAFYTNVVLVPS